MSYLGILRIHSAFQLIAFDHVWYRVVSTLARRPRQVSCPLEHHRQRCMLELGNVVLALSMWSLGLRCRNDSQPKYWQLQAGYIVRTLRSYKKECGWGSYLEMPKDPGIYMSADALVILSLRESSSPLVLLAEFHAQQLDVLDSLVLLYTNLVIWRRWQPEWTRNWLKSWSMYPLCWISWSQWWRSKSPNLSVVHRLLSATKHHPISQ